MQFPKSVDECVYFTNRFMGNGLTKCWVFKQDCPKCKKAKMSKPIVAGKVAIRAKEYVCPACKYTVDKSAYEETLLACISYTCPACNATGEMEVPFKRKSINGVKTLRVFCRKCNAPIDITKKMKEMKDKKKGKADVDPKDADDD
ncbi:MAG: hypothetical protein V1725_05455 [archaeon]